MIGHLNGRCSAINLAGDSIVRRSSVRRAGYNGPRHTARPQPAAGGFTLDLDEYCTQRDAAQRRVAQPASLCGACIIASTCISDLARSSRPPACLSIISSCCCCRSCCDGMLDAFTHTTADGIVRRMQTAQKTAADASAAAATAAANEAEFNGCCCCSSSARGRY